MVLILILLVLNIPFYILFMKMYFGDWDGLKKAIIFLPSLQIVSAFRGEFWEDWWNEIKLLLYGLTIGTMNSVEYALLSPYISF